uniref:Uncharacterized protein n=1 Tax=Meloidogyne hapla TaxID=6305 RepID=A0A1I8BKA7_MELHA
MFGFSLEVKVETPSSNSLSNNYDLTKRYQYRENMRTTMQLFPTLFFYFLVQMNFMQAFLNYTNKDMHYREIIV